MSRSLLHEWEHDIVKYSINVGEMMKVAKDIYDTAYARGKANEKTGHCEDVVSRQAVKHKLQEHHDLFINAYGGRVGFKSMADAKEKARVDEINNCIAMIVNEPSVTPKENIGHWIVDWSATSRLNRDRSLTYEYHVHCNRCRYRWDYTTDRKESLVSNYCHNCGAKMQEVENKNSNDIELVDNKCLSCRWQGSLKDFCEHCKHNLKSTASIVYDMYEEEE